MLTIIHGSDTVLSRKHFLEEKQKYPGAVHLDAEQVNLTDLTQLFEGGGLFGETKNLFIEQFLTKRKKNADYKEILAYFEKSAAENTIVLWEGKELERGTLSELRNATVKIFKLPQTLFQLLDSIQPGNAKLMIKLFHETIKTTETEMVFFMLVRQFRLLVALSNQTNPRHSGERERLQKPDSGQARMTDIIDELRRMAPWQKTKLQKQTKSFDLSHLLDLYDKLFQIETAQKTGSLTAPLVSTIDFFFLEV